MAVKRKLIISSLAVSLAALAFAGCAKKAVTVDLGAGAEGKQQKAEAIKPDIAEVFKNGSAASKGIEPGDSTSGARPQATPTEPFGLAGVHFDFDRYTIRDNEKGIIEKDAGILKDNGDINVVIEGRCDERGSDEYNLALGERRADAVKKYLVDLGVAPGRISTVSYGDQKPLCPGHDEECWQKNRTAQFAVKK